MKKISEKQREFAKLIAIGKQQTKAYQEVYGCDGKNQGVVRAAAARLAKNKEVIELINEYRARANRSSIMPTERRIALLYEQLEVLVEAENMGGLFKIIDLLNKMEGAYEMQKQEVKKAQMETEKERKAENEIPWLPLGEGMREEIINRSEKKARAIAHAQARERAEKLGQPSTTEQGEGSPYGQEQTPPDEGTATQGNSEEGQPPEG